MKRGVWIPITPDPATPHLRRVAAKLLRNGKYKGTKFSYYDPDAGWVKVKARDSRLMLEAIDLGATDEEIAGENAIDSAEEAAQAAIVAAEEAAAAEAEAEVGVVEEPIPDPAPEPVVDPVI